PTVFDSLSLHDALPIYDQFVDKSSECVSGKRHFESKKFRAATKPFEMLRPADWLTSVDQHCFEQAIAVEKAAVENGDHCLLFWKDRKSTRLNSSHDQIS